MKLSKKVIQSIDLTEKIKYELIETDLHDDQFKIEINKLIDLCSETRAKIQVSDRIKLAIKYDKSKRYKKKQFKTLFYKIKIF